MNLTDFLTNVLPWVTQAVMGAVVLWLALRKAPIENSSLESGTIKNYADAAKIKAEENRELQSELENMSSRLLLVENKKFKIVMEFTIGDPPEMGKVTIEPIVDLTKLEKAKVSLEEKK